MLEFLIMLLGLAFPNSDANTSVTTDTNQNQTVTVNAQSPDDGTGGNNGQVKP